MKVNIYCDANLNYSLRIVMSTLPTPEATFDNINFIQGDGINTTLTLNVSDDLAFISPNYLSVDTGNTKHPNQYWWVISCYRERQGQITLGLYRDFIRENWTGILYDNTWYLIHKASQIPEVLSYAQYRKTMNMSQVKKKSISLVEYPSSLDPNYSEGQGWLVGYVSKERDTESGTEPVLAGKTFQNTTICPYSVTFPSALWTGTPTSAYDIFAIPVGGYFTISLSDGTSFHSNLTLEIAKEVATMLAVELGSNLYDLQYLPYVTLSDLTNREIPEAEYSVGVIKNGTDNIGGIPVLTTDTREFTLPVTSALSSLADEFNAITTPIDRRKYEEKHMTRLVSPNYASQFEFSLIKNGTSFPAFQVSIGLRPYNPFIYVHPEFGNLYGINDKDGRGLILSGDFSLDRIDSAWTEYQLQNKNYQLSFDRGIESLDLKNTYAEQVAGQARANSVLKGISSTVAGTVGGAITGAKYGGAVGAIGGAVLGGGLSGVMSGYNTANTFENTAMESQIRADERQASIDQFQYQLGNVQATPNTLTKVGAVNPNFKVFPQLEIYECTDQESKNLDSAIQYSGIDIEMIDTMEDFTKGFVSATILSSVEMYEFSAEQIDAISREFERGVYLYSII